MNDPIVSVPMSDLMRVLPFKASNDIRYYLNGVLVTPHKQHALLVATNGHWLAVYESEKARIDQPRILDIPDWFAHQLRSLEDQPAAYGDVEDDEIALDGHSYVPPRGTIPRDLVVSDATSRLAIVQSKVELLVKPGDPFIDGTFPDWRKPLPDRSMIDRGLRQAISPYYLSRLREAVPQECEHALFAYHQRDGGERSAVLFRFGNLPGFVVALMPRNDGDAEPKDWPEWMTKEVGEQPQAA